MLSLRFVVPLVAIAVLVAILRGGHVPSLQVLKDNHATLVQMYQDTPLAFVLMYSSCYLILTVLCIPGVALLTIGAGSVMGTGVGCIVAAFASATGALLSSAFARYLARDFVAGRFQDTYRKFNSNVEQNGLAYLAALRLTPLVPYFVVNLLVGISTLRLTTFFLISLLAIVPSAIAYSNAGAQLAKLHSVHDVMSLNMILALTLVGLVPILSLIVWRAFKPKENA